MKRLALIPLLATAALTLHAETYVDNARVRSVEPQYESVTVPRQECSSQWVNETRQTVNEVQSRLTGYQVHYEYRGQQFTTLMRENPGPSLQVRVSVDPVAAR